MDHNDYAKNQVTSSSASESIYSEADNMIDSLKQELETLSEQAKTLSDSYIQQKRDGYLKTWIVKVSVATQMEFKRGFIYTIFFAVALCGYWVTRAMRIELYKYEPAFYMQ